MNIDIGCLLDAKVENVERLAGSLGLSLPEHEAKDGLYARRLARLVAGHLSRSRPRRFFTWPRGLS